MIETSPSSSFSDFLRFWAALGGRPPGARDGADKEEIVRLEKLMRHRLPPFYAEFLHRCGRMGYDFPLVWDGSLSIDWLFELYEPLETLGPDDLPRERHIPRDCVIVGAPGITTLGRGLLYVGAQQQQEEPTFVTTSHEHVIHVAARTFANALYAVAFHVRRFDFEVMPWRPHHPQLSIEGESNVKEVVNWAQAQGFRPYWFSDEYQAVLERKDAYVHVFADLGFTRAFVGADHPALAVAIGEALARDLGMTLYV
jgi:hypothetical protein